MTYLIAAKHKQEKLYFQLNFQELKWYFAIPYAEYAQEYSNQY